MWSGNYWYFFTLLRSEPQCICVAAGVAVARGARMSVASRGDIGLWEESVPTGGPAFSCITSFHLFSQFFSGGYLRFFREAINPPHTMTIH